MNRLTPWLARTAALTILAALFAAAHVAVVAPLVAAYQGNLEAIADAEAVLDRFQHMAGTEAGLQSKLGQLKERQAAQGYYLTKRTDALAAAELQERVKGIVQEQGGTIRSIQTLPGKDERDFRQVALRLQLTMTTDSLFRTLLALETGKPFLFIDDIDVQARAARQADGQPADPSLVVAVDLHGYRQPEKQ